jgi:hypothetical protein
VKISTPSVEAIEIFQRCVAAEVPDGLGAEGPIRGRRLDLRVNFRVDRLAPSVSAPDNSASDICKDAKKPVRYEKY